jgi:hypothetical protein
MTSLKADSLTVDEDVDFKNADLVINNFLLSSSQSTSTRFIEKCSTIPEAVKGLFSLCANNLLSDLERQVPTMLQNLMMQLRRQFYSRLWSHVGSLSAAMETELVRELSSTPSFVRTLY